MYFEKIRDFARDFGIAGEITQASPARTPQELTQIALEKNYSTIVAIGHDIHINRVVSAILNLNPDIPVSLGIISTDPDSMLYGRWGFKHPEEACEMLKYRKLERFSVGMVEPNHYFLTSIKIEPPKTTRITLEVDHWKADALIDRAEISGNLYILLERFKKTGGVVSSTINWLLGKNDEDVDRSIFKAKIIRILSKEPLPITIDDQIIARTPANIYRKLNALNIITKRDKIMREINKD
jgi:hypothetical protein